MEQPVRDISPAAIILTGSQRPGPLTGRDDPKTWSIRRISPCTDDAISQAAEVHAWLCDPQGFVSPIHWIGVTVPEKAQDLIGSLRGKVNSWLKRGRIPLLVPATMLHRPTPQDALDRQGTSTPQGASGTQVMPDEPFLQRMAQYFKDDTEFNAWYEERRHDLRKDGKPITLVRRYKEEPPMGLLLWDLPKWRMADMQYNENGPMKARRAKERTEALEALKSVFDAYVSVNGPTGSSKNATDAALAQALDGALLARSIESIPILLSKGSITSKDTATPKGNTTKYDVQGYTFDDETRDLAAAVLKSGIDAAQCLYDINKREDALDSPLVKVADDFIAQARRALAPEG